jgi:hypothetical protein
MFDDYASYFQLRRILQLSGEMLGVIFGTVFLIITTTITMTFTAAAALSSKPVSRSAQRAG